MVQVISYEKLPTTDLVIDAVYEGVPSRNLSGAALSKLLPGIGNLGGFRAAGHGDDKKFVILYTSGEDKDWPDRLDLNTGQFVYFGDNKSPGHELHDTGRRGNRILRRVFDLLHATPPDRKRIPPFFIFKKYPTPQEFSVRSVQGARGPRFHWTSCNIRPRCSLENIKGQRFQNYQATFSVLDAPVINRAWLCDLANGISLTTNVPEAWSEWVSKGRYRALTAESTTVIRGRDEQVPDSPTKTEILETVWLYFKEAPCAFEAFAARLFQMHDQRVIIDEITRAAVDGGRDAVGKYLLGLSDDPVYAEFSLEAKCYKPPLFGQTANSVGVKEVSRLISRIRNREFGVLVTTSVIGRQAYKEVREDRHPIIFFCGKDIADILMTNGFNTPKLVRDLLQNEFALRREDA